MGVAVPWVGPYRVLEKLGAGAMGEVYLAEDTRLRRRVALKTVLQPANTALKARQRLLREARAVARLNHPSIAAIYDVVESPSSVHIVMEYVRGETLAARLRRGPLPPATVVSLGIQLADALAEAHAMGKAGEASEDPRDPKCVKTVPLSPGESAEIKCGFRLTFKGPNATYKSPDDNRTYKYDIVADGWVLLDPEIEVRR
jgi:serine/threonine protein kinase